MRSHAHMHLILAAMLSLPENVAAQASEPETRKPVETDEWGNPLQVIKGRNAAKRARRAISKSYGGPAKTPKGLRGKE